MPRAAEVPIAYAPPVRSRRFHVVAGTIVVALGTAVYVLARAAWTRVPARGYTPLGLTLAVAASVLFLTVLLYSWRKRTGQGLLPGRLQTWLRLHVWLSALGTWAALLHAGFHAGDVWGTVALAVLGFVVVTGVVGWWLYVRVPPVVDRAVNNLAVPWTDAKIRELERALTALEAGASDALRARLTSLRAGQPEPTGLGNLAPGEDALLAEARERARTLVHERERRRLQGRYKRWLRLWLWLHVPVACLLPLVIAYHALDALEVGTKGEPRASHRFADPFSCAQCHHQQVDEWLGSMHSMAMSSPTVDLQHRLVVAVDRRLKEPVAGNLCALCHAPTGHHPGLTDAEEPLLARVEERAQASAYGISCVVCHQISEVHGHGANGRLPEPLHEIEHRNIDNLVFTPGRTMLGAFGAHEGLLAVGNAGHPSAFSAAFGGERAGGERETASSLCASCHTVVVDRPDRVLSRGTGEPVALQNTYREWIEGGTAKDALHWNRAGVQCVDCHARDLKDLAQQVRGWGDRKAKTFLTLEERRKRIVERVQANAAGALAGEDAFAALPADGFDRPLPARRRYRHTFTGVDLPLDDETPLLPGALGLADDARKARNRQIRKDMFERRDDLLALAAAVEIDKVATGAKGKVQGRVMNLATGHHLPAGFAFAREMWLEVTRVRGGKELVLVGGDGRGEVLGAKQDLVAAEKARKDFVNLQAVLWNGEPAPAEGAYNASGETVIQLEVPRVLAGKAAQEAGFPDRKGPLLPGHMLAFDIDCGELRPGDAVRVRLLFRNFPPKFLADLRHRLKSEHPALPSGTSEVQHDLDRLAGLVSGLSIREIARDER